MHSLLKEKLYSLANLPEKQWLQFEKMCFSLELKSGEHFVLANEDASTVGFLTEGFCRRYYLNEDGTEYTHSFYLPGQFIGSYASTLTDQKANTNVVAVKNSKVVAFKIKNFRSFYEVDRAWETCARKVVEMLYIERENREYQLLMLSATERLIRFKKDYADLYEKLSNTMVASYLGITPEALSRLNKKMK